MKNESLDLLPNWLRDVAIEELAGFEPKDRTLQTFLQLKIRQYSILTNIMLDMDGIMMFKERNNEPIEDELLADYDRAYEEQEMVVRQLTVIESTINKDQ